MVGRILHSNESQRKIKDQETQETEHMHGDGIRNNAPIEMLYRRKFDLARDRRGHN